MLKRLVVFAVIIGVLMICFVSCSNDTADQDIDNNNSSQETLSVNSENESEDEFLSAENELKEFFEYYESDFSGVESKGLTVISEKRFYVFEMSEFDGYSYYVSIDENCDIYGGYPDSGMDCLWKNGKPYDDWQETDITSDDAMPYVSVDLDVLNRSFEGYKNQTGATFFDKTNGNMIASYYIKKNSAINYFYGTNELFIGVENGELNLVLGYCSDLVDKTSPTVRDIINALGISEMFDVQPSVYKVSNNNNVRNFICWKVNNGYVGFVTIGNIEHLSCYDLCAFEFLMFEDWDCINLVEE